MNSKMPLETKNMKNTRIMTSKLKGSKRKAKRTKRKNGKINKKNNIAMMESRSLSRMKKNPNS